LSTSNAALLNQFNGNSNTVPEGDRDEEEGGQSSAPSGPVSLFDFLETQIPAKTPTAAAAQSSKPDTKTFDKEKPKTENFNRGEKNPRDNNKDSRGGRRDFESKGKSSNGQQSGSRNDERKKDAPSDRKDNSDRRKDDSRKKGENKKNDKRGGDRNSQPKEFAPVFHGKSAVKNPEKSRHKPQTREHAASVKGRRQNTTIGLA